jgi:hypothetical protein
MSTALNQEGKFRITQLEKRTDTAARELWCKIHQAGARGGKLGYKITATTGGATAEEDALFAINIINSLVPGSTLHSHCVSKYNPADAKGGYAMWKHIMMIQSDASVKQTVDMAIKKGLQFDGQKPDEMTDDYNHRVKGLINGMEIAKVKLFDTSFTGTIKEAREEIIMALTKECMVSEVDQAKLEAIENRTVDLYDQKLATIQERQEQRQEEAGADAFMSPGKITRIPNGQKKQKGKEQAPRNEAKPNGHQKKYGDKPCFGFQRDKCTDPNCDFGHFKSWCRDFDMGKCARGSKCGHIHDVERQTKARAAGAAALAADPSHGNPNNINAPTTQHAGQQQLPQLPPPPQQQQQQQQHAAQPQNGSSATTTIDSGYLQYLQAMAQNQGQNGMFGQPTGYFGVPPPQVPPGGPPVTAPGQASAHSFIAFAFLSAFSYMFSDFWILDTGCTQHMSPYSADFQSRTRNITPINGINKDTPIYSTEVGTIVQNLNNVENTSNPVSLSNVLLSDKLPVRLFSFNRAWHKGASLAITAPTPSGHSGYLHLPCGTKLALYHINGFFCFRIASQSAFISPPTANTETVFSTHASLPHARLLTHLRLCHAGTEVLANTMKSVFGTMPFSPREALDPCLACIQGKAHHAPCPHNRIKNPTTRNPKHRLIHTDWWGKFHHPGVNKELWIQVFIDDASGYACVYPSRSKDQGVENLAKFKATLRELTNDSVEITVVQADYEKVYTHGSFEQYCIANSILQRFSAPYSHQQNRIAERYWRTMETFVSAMLNYSSVPLYLWPHAVLTFAHHHNCMVSARNTATPYELLTGTKPDISTLRVWGCPVQCYVEKHDRKKFGSKTVTGINLGPAPFTKDGFYVYFKEYNRSIRVTRHISFDELWRARHDHYKMLNQKFPDTVVFPPAPPPPPPDFPPDAEPTYAEIEPAFPHVPAATPPVTPVMQPLPNPDLVPTTPMPHIQLNNNQTPLINHTATAENTAAASQQGAPLPIAPKQLPIAQVIQLPQLPIAPPPASEANPLPLITRISKKFGNTYFYGTATRTAGAYPYNVVYDDEDTETMSNTELINCINLYKKRSRFDPHPLNPAATSQRKTRSNAFLSFCFATVGTSLIATAAPVTTALFGSPSFFPSQPLHNVKYSPVSEQTAHTYAQNRAATAFFNEFFTNNPDKAAYAFVSISLPTGATPSTFQEAVNSVDRRHWRFAIQNSNPFLMPRHGH